MISDRQRRDAVRRTYGDLAHRYDARWWRYLEESIGATLRGVAFRPEERVLDVGCGSGLLLERILAGEPATAAVGVDLSAEMLYLSRRERRWRSPPLLVAGDAARLPFRDARFDTALSTSSLHSWPEPEHALAEIARIVRPGGRLILTDWCRDIVLFRPFGFFLRLWDPTVARVYSRAELCALLEGSGFSVGAANAYRVASYWGAMTITSVRKA